MNNLIRTFGEPDEVVEFGGATEQLISIGGLTVSRRGADLVFEGAGEHELKGVPDRWHLYRVVS